MKMADWFIPPEPDEQEDKDILTLQKKYLNLAEDVLIFCGENPDRDAALRKLKESSQAAISAIVCFNTWQE